MKPEDLRGSILFSIETNNALAEAMQQSIRLNTIEDRVAIPLDGAEAIVSYLGSMNKMLKELLDGPEDFNQKVA